MPYMSIRAFDSVIFNQIIENPHRRYPLKSNAGGGERKIKIKGRLVFY